jgi:hypothetical protein
MKKKLLLGCFVVFLAIGIFISRILSADVQRITKDELKSLLGKPDVIVLDVRTGNDWKDSDLKIQGAIREEPGEVNSWSKNTPRRRSSFSTAPDPMKEQVPGWHKN